MNKQDNIHEFNCFMWVDETSLERKWYGVEIEPVSDLNEAIKLAKIEARETFKNETLWAAGYSIGGDIHNGEYHQFDNPIQLN